MIRIERAAGQTVVKAMTTKGAVLRYEHRSREVWDELTARIVVAGFWGLPADAPSQGFVLHGNSCVVEGWLGGSYHVVDRGTLETSREFSALCNYFFAAASVESPFSRYFLEATDPPRGMSLEEVEAEDRLRSAR